MNRELRPQNVPMVALSVSISATESPAAKASPSWTFHSAMVPASMVGERAGMPTTRWYGRSSVDMCRIWFRELLGVDSTDREDGERTLLPDSDEKVAADADAAVTPGSRLAVIPAAAAEEEAELLIETADAAAAEEADRILRAAWRAALRPTPSVWDMTMAPKVSNQTRGVKAVRDQREAKVAALLLPSAPFFFPIVAGLCFFLRWRRRPDQK